MSPWYTRVPRPVPVRSGAPQTHNVVAARGGVHRGVRPLLRPAPPSNIRQVPAARGAFLDQVRRVSGPALAAQGNPTVLLLPLT